MLQCWEAFFRFQLDMFEKEFNSTNSTTNTTINILNAVSEFMDGWALETGISKHNHSKDHMADVARVSVLLNNIHDSFKNFAEAKCATDETFRFWHTFVHVDCFAYISLYIAIRSGDWNLRNYSIKLMAPLFHVVGSKYYYKLLPYHLADLKTFPSSVLNNLACGGFVMNIAGLSNWSNVALDETHEMTINKDVKEVMSIGSMTGITNKIHYMPFRANLLQNFCTQLIIARDNQQSDNYGKLFEDNELNIKSLLDTQRVRIRN